MEEFPLEAASELELLGVEEAASEEEEEGSEEAGSEEASEEVSELEEVSSGYMGAGHQGDCLNDCAPLEIHQLWLHHDDLAILDSLQLRKGFIVRKLLLDLGRAENIIRIAGGQSAELHFPFLEEPATFTAPANSMSSLAKVSPVTTAPVVSYR